MGKSIIKNYIYNNILLVFNLIYPILTTIYINNIFSLEQIGEINYSLGIINIFILLSSLGIQNYGIREISMNKDKIDKIFWELFLLNIISMVFFYLILIIIIFYFFYDYFLYIIIFSFNMIMSVLNLDWFYIGIEECDYITKRSIFVKLLSMIGMLIFIKNKNDTLIYVVLLCCGYSLNSFFNIFNLKKYIKEKPSELKILRHIKNLKYFYFSILIGIFANGGDQIILGLYSSMNEVAYYSRNRQIIGILMGVLVALFKSIISRTNEIFKKNRNDYNSMLYQSTAMTIFLIVPLFFIPLFLGKEILFIIGKEKFLGGLTSLKLLSFVILFSGIATWLNYQICIPEKKEKVIFYGLIFLNIFNLSFVYKVGYRYGIIGISLGILIGEIINLIVILLMLRMYKIKYLFLRKENINFLFSGIISIIIINFIKKDVNSILISIFLIALYGIFYLCFILLIDILVFKMFFIKILLEKGKMKKIKKYLIINNYINFFKNKIQRVKECYYYYFCPKKMVENSFIELEVSNICNALCIFCPWMTIKKTNKKFNMMSLDTYEKVLKKISLQNHKNISFTPTTGELLVNRQWDKYIEKAFYLENIDKIIFYSNGILLDKENREKLIKLLKIKESKLKELHFSIGGIDSKTYNLMYGVNKFEQVSQNIIFLLKELKEMKEKVNVLIEIRLPKDSNVEKDDINKYFNYINYKYLTIRVLRDFIPISCIPKHKKLNYTNKILNKKKPCKYLYKTRYDANGGIWADGCVISELPDNEDLKLGTVDDNLEKIEKNRKNIIENWKKGKLPEPCKNCQIYQWY